VELTNQDVADILALLDSLPYDELDLRTTAFRLTLRRAAGGGWAQSRQELAGPAVLAAGPAADEVADGDGMAGMTAADGQADGGGTPAATGAAAAPPGPPSTAAGALVDVTAPLPGTFYRAPRPGAAPFTEAGATVGPDTVVAIVETMKLMNPVHAGASGTVAEILVANAETVAQGATLLRFDPAPAGAP
jgi:acetyl-CoA carboxylase biotin carboxyl carrier protein